MAGSDALPLVVILGPTAVGKTGLAIELAQVLNGEIVGADSRQVYRYMDIGTAKPTAEQCAQAPHHLIGVVDPDENLSLADYLNLAKAAIDSIHGRGRLPLLVGGTGQYITALVQGWNVPKVSPDEKLRAELEMFALARGAEALHKRLRAIDPAAADAIHPNNIRRVVRALEVTLLSGQLFSNLQRKSPPPYRIQTYGLTLHRDRLYERADSRVDRMMEAGFLEEVRGLLDLGYRASLPSMSGLGYAQLATHLAGTLPLERAIADTKSATHDFIRRQYTWLRGHDHGILWHNVEQIDLQGLIAACGRWMQD